MYAHDEFEPDHTSSPTDTMIQDLQLYGYRPAAGEADPRITPEDHVIQTAVADIFDALISTMADTSLDFDLGETADAIRETVERFAAAEIGWTITSKRRNAFNANRTAPR